MISSGVYQTLALMLGEGVEVDGRRASTIGPIWARKVARGAGF
jgi:hypothetical protein